MAGYYKRILNDLQKGTIGVHTVNHRIGTAKRFVYWCYEEELIDSLPRNLNRLKPIRRKLQPIETFSVEDVRQLFNGCRDSQLWGMTMRCYICLALNTGMTQVDISSLTRDEIDFKSGRIIRHRKKTGVYAEHLLWRVTVELLHEAMSKNPILNDEGKALAFHTQQRRPLRWSRYRDGKQSNSDSISKRFLSLRRELWGDHDRGLGFRTFRKTGATAISEMDFASLRLVQLYLAHSPGPIAHRHYIKVSFDDLDRAIRELEDRYRLGC